MPVAAFSPVRPPPICFSPIWMMPLRKVPLVSTTDLQAISIPKPVITPTTLLPPVVPGVESCSIFRPATMS